MRFSAARIIATKLCGSGRSRRATTPQNFPEMPRHHLALPKGGHGDFQQVYEEYDPEYVENVLQIHRRGRRRYQLRRLINPNKNRPNLTYEFLGVTRVWRWTRERMERAYEDGLMFSPKPGAVPQFKRYLTEMQGQPVTTIGTTSHLQAARREASAIRRKSH